MNRGPHLSDLLANPEDLAWRRPKNETLLRNFLDCSYHVYMESMTALKESLTAFKEKLYIDEALSVVGNSELDEGNSMLMRG